MVSRHLDFFIGLVEPGLAAAVRAHHRATTEIVTDPTPTEREIAAIVAAAADHQVLIVGTIDAGAQQANLVEALLATRKPMITIALRTPYDLARYPTASTYLCTYGIHPPSLGALGDGLFGLVPIEGRLPVSIPDLYPIGHGTR